MHFNLVKLAYFRENYEGREIASSHKEEAMKTATANYSHKL